MVDTYHIIDGQVVPYSGGRKCNNTDAWRDATQLELQLQEQLDEYEHIIAAQTAEIEALREEVELLRLKDAIHKRSRERLAEALLEAYGKVRELCGCYGLPYPSESFARYEALLRDEEGR